MAFSSLFSTVSRRPLVVAVAWFLLALGIEIFSPSLTKLAAEGQANVLGPDAASSRAAKILAEAWPDQSYQSLAVAALHRPGGLTDADKAYTRTLATLFSSEKAPSEVLRVLGPNSDPEVAARLNSADGTVSMLAIPLSRSFVSPPTQSAVNWLQRQAIRPETLPPPGLEVRWTGDAVMGRDYMKSVQTSLDRAAIATVFLLLIVLVSVYRSVWLAAVPLVTIGTSLLISRSLLAWLHVWGWETSPLVELFLVAVLFGSGTDFCLFISWRFAEHWDAANPARAMLLTLKNSSGALITSAGTVIIGLLLMGTTRFALFSTTGPSVALGLVISLAATLTLTPALLVMLAKRRPQAFAGLTAPSTRLWERLGRLAMARPLISWMATLALMIPMATVAWRTTMVQDLLNELPRETNSASTFRLLSDKFGPGMLAPLTVVLESANDFRDSEGLALIDDVSRFLERQRALLEVRSATQPLGSRDLLARARIKSRLGEVNSGFAQIADGANQLEKGLSEGAAKLRAAIWLESKTGLSLIPSSGSTGATPERQDAAASGADETVQTDPNMRPASYPNLSPTPGGAALAAGLRRASAALLNTGVSTTWPSTDSKRRQDVDHPPTSSDDPRQRLIDEILTAANGAAQIADGARRAETEVGSILTDPVGQRALDRLLVDARTVRENPELNRSFDTYITPDGHRARIDLSPAHRVFSAGAMDQVESLRRRLDEYLGDMDGPRVKAMIAGSNAESTDVRAMTRADQIQSWVVIPLGVFLVLLVALRDPVVCLNLVATMLLTYCFALGATHLVFVVGLGAEGLDWKVPYFLFVLLVAVGVDYNVFLMARLNEETSVWGLRKGIVRAIGETGGLITSAAAITACSFASFMSSPLVSLRQLGFALVIGIMVDALFVRPLLVPCGHWLLKNRRQQEAVAGELQIAPPSGV